MKCEIPTCEKKGIGWYIKINQENTKTVTGHLCIEHYHQFVNVLVEMMDFLANKEKKR